MSTFYRDMIEDYKDLLLVADELQFILSINALQSPPVVRTI